MTQAWTSFAQPRSAPDYVGRAINHIVTSCKFYKWLRSSAQFRSSFTPTNSVTMPGLTVSRPSAAEAKESSRAFALLHQLDPTEKGIDAQVRRLAQGE